MSVIGRLKVLMTADSAQVVSNLGKARRAVRDAGQDMSKNAAKSSKQVSESMGKIGAQADGAGTAISGLTQAMALAGARIRPEISGIAGAFAGLAASGVGPLAVGLVALGAVTFSTAEAIKLLRADSDAASEAILRQAAATDRLRSVRAEMARLDRADRIARTGKAGAVLDVEDEIAGTLKKLEAVRFQIERLRRRVGGGSFLGLDIAGEERALNIAEGAAARLAARVEELERARTTVLDRESTARVQREREAAAKRIEILTNMQDRMLRATDSVRERLDVIRDVNLGRGPLERTLKGIDRSEERLIRDLQRAGNDSPDAIAAIRARFDAEREVVRAEALRRRKDATAAVDAEAAEILARIRDLGRDQLIARIDALHRQRDAELAAAKESGVEVAAVRSKFLALERLERAEHAKALADAAVAEDERARGQLEREQAAAASRLTSARESLTFELAQLGRSETEQQVAEVERRYAETLANARRHGQDTVALEKLIAERIREIRADAQADGEPSSNDPDEAGPSTFSGGFHDRMAEIREQLGDMGKLGRRVADDITDGLATGVSAALLDVAQNARSASEAFREMGASLAWAVAQDLIRDQIKSGVSSLLGDGSGSSGSSGSDSGGGDSGATGGAHGGSWRVAGYGGLDSQLVKMKLSPGELVTVSDGANSGGADGDVRVALTVRPPAVIADEVMAKSSRDARAAVVGSALERPGRRGRRAR